MPASTSAATQLATAITRYLLLYRLPPGCGGVGLGSARPSPPPDAAVSADETGDSGPMVEDVAASAGWSPSSRGAGAFPPVPLALLSIATSRPASPNSIRKIVSPCPP